MAYDEEMAQRLRDALEGVPGISERKMFGGQCMLLNGHMLCGVHGGSKRDPEPGCMFRVGEAGMEAARAIPGTGPMNFTGKPMKGMINVDFDLLADDARLKSMLDLALSHASSLPPK